MRKLAGAIRDMFVAEQHVLPDTQQYDPMGCQCCGYTKTSDTALECVCDRLPWYMLPDGNVECQAHKFARAGLFVPGASSKPRWFGPRK
jgi:hypothetical protein